ncbi:MAG: hypothetical protein CFH26_00586 [Alphaproteobacteria bacterium MarineAlpha6_Bin4]|nr:MAG: hypothetical protein CFH27_00021 [Alphaproteobacteria bacterium MarineAlpha6_Bin5]PPR37717.1 MAG: hypothetical protein CFH26_00586 [Alphaproteobacteria bacterium MarineAlpha6_Bin4]|tara:strand:- start:2886 stop:3569 length:684 start_codon:yes stop_codon:yes gene_type:complete
MSRLLVFFLFFFIVSCSSFNTEPKYTIRVFDKDKPKVLLMPIDIEICELTLAGMCEPKASWTNESRENIITSFKEILDKRNASLNEYDKNSTNEDVNQIIKLHTQIGQEIINNEYGPFKLPTKNEFDWSIGKEAQILRKEHKSDYAIFIFFRDQYSSTERVLYNIVTAVLFPGIIPIGGSQLAFASLVNLNNGEITWFNGYYRSFGDVRDLESARATIEKLFEEFPG